MRPFRKTRRLVLQQFLPLALTIACVTGCSEPSSTKPRHEAKGRRGVGSRPGELMSANSLLGAGDYEKFRPGRSRADVLNDVQWRGNFVEATTYEGKSVSVISYGLFGGPFSDHGTAVLAIFVDDKFEKFVRWPKGDAKIAVGDFSILVRALESDPVSSLDLEIEMNSKSGVPKQIDLGLTATWLLFGERVEAARATGLKKNAVLRDQFNAARLKLGMTQAEVETLLKAKPIDSGQVEAGSFKIYGGTESFDITADLHYSNIFVVLKEGRLTGIYSGEMVPGGDQGLRQTRESFIGLRRQHDK